MIGNALLLALRQIFRNPLRSMLTVLGIVIGVAAVITMVTVGNGATQQVRDQIASLGSDTLMIRPGQRMGPGQSIGARLLKKQMQKPFHSKLPVFVRSLLPEVIQPLSLPMEKTG